MQSAFIKKIKYFQDITNDVHEICQPLFQNSGITNFNNLRVYNDGSIYVLISNGEYLKYHAERELLAAPQIPNNTANSKVTKCFFIGMPNESGIFSQVLHDARTIFNINYPIYLMERHADYCDFYTFASTASNHGIVNFYLNNMDILEKFKLYFKEKAKKLLINAYKNRAQLPKHMQPASREKSENFYSHDLDRQKILTALKTKNSFIYRGNLVSLSTQELDIIKHLELGHTAKETSKSMNISPRTVEHYLENIKHKLNCHKKVEIVSIILKHI